MIKKESPESKQYYENHFSNIREIFGDGNCLYHAISYHLTGSQMSDEKIRLETYKYIVNNKTFVYDYC